MADELNVTYEQVEAARKAGHSDDDIVRHLTPSAPEKFNAAVKAGHTSTQILEHLAPQRQEPPPNPTMGSPEDVAVRPHESWKVGPWSELALSGVPVAGALVNKSKEAKELEEKHPIGSVIAKGVGATAALAPLMMAAPAAFGVAAGAPLMMNMGMGAATGGLIGAADAAARKEPITSGGVTGALTAAGTSVIGKGLGAVFSKVLDWVKPEAKGVLKGFDSKALEWAATAAKRDGLTDVQIADMINKKGAHAFLAEYSPSLTGAASEVAGASGTVGKNNLFNKFEARSKPDAVRQRTTDGLDSIMGKPVNQTQLMLERVDDRAKGPGSLFDQFRNLKIQPTGAVKAVAEDIEKLVPGLLNEAKTVANLRSAATGKPVSPMENFFTAGTRKDWPTAESWMMVKKAINARIAANTTVNPHTGLETLNDSARALMGLKKRIDTAINQSPNKQAASIWKQANAQWADETSVMNAAVKGKSVFNPNYNKNQLFEDVSNMSGAERAAHREGVRSELQRMIEASTGGDAKVREMLRSPANKEKLDFLTRTKTVDPTKFLNSLEHEAEYMTTKEALRTTQGAQAKKAMHEIMTPDASKTMIGRFEDRFPTGLHFTNPVRYVPGYSTLKAMSMNRANRQAEAGRDSLGQMLTAQGPEAQALAAALLRYNPSAGGPQAGMNTAAVVRSLLQPNLPGTPVPFLTDKNKSQ